MIQFPMRPALALCLCIASGVIAGGPAMAQAGGVSASREVVQALPNEAATSRTAALRILAKNPRNLEALLNAGNSSLALDDVDAATGFFTRAQAVGGDGGRAKAGLAAAQVRNARPLDALRLFSEAEREGASLEQYQSDHGLAYDLVGDNLQAQYYYRQALDRQLNAGGSDEELIRRLALSQAVAGDRIGSEATLLPLLQHQDLAAYRTRAFALAVLGRQDEAVAIAEAVMPASLASQIAPYLRYMQKLTRSQQVAAATFGHFPQAAAIGKDDPAIAAYTSRASVPPMAAQDAGSRLVPAGEPLGQKPIAKRRTNKPQANIAQTGSDELAPLIAAESAPEQGRDIGPGPDLATMQQPEPVHQTAAEAASKGVGELPPVDPAPRAAPVPGPSISIATAGKPQPEQAGDAIAGFDLAAIKGSKAIGDGPAVEAPDTMAVAVEPISVTQAASAIAADMVVETAARPPMLRPAEPKPGAVAVAAEEPTSLSAAFAAFSAQPDTLPPAAGAVDIAGIEPPREVREKEKPKQAKVEPPKPAHPSRVWVQIATGRDTSALRFDWRRISRKAGELFKGRSGFIGSWGQTNRLVTGPFADRKQAQAFVSSLGQEGVDSFLFTSVEGEELAPLPR